MVSYCCEIQMQLHWKFTRNFTRCRKKKKLRMLWTDYTTGPCSSMLNSRLLYRLLFGSTASSVYGLQINFQLPMTVCLNSVLAIFHFVFVVSPGPTILPNFNSRNPPEKKLTYTQCSLVSRLTSRDSSRPHPQAPTIHPHNCPQMHWQLTVCGPTSSMWRWFICPTLMLTDTTGVKEIWST